MESVTSKRKQTTSCGACVYRLSEGEIYLLLVRPFKDRDTWGVPKGHIDEGETIEDCARREVYEETGINVTLEEELLVVSTKFKNEHKKVITFLASQTCDKVPFANDGENVDVRWFKSSELPVIHVYQRPLILNAIEHILSRMNADS